MPETVQDANLFRGLTKHEANSALGSARRAELEGQCWLENYTSAEECIAVVTSGCVGLRPIGDDADGKAEILPRNAPAIVDLSRTEGFEVGHWLADKSTVYFFTAGGLERAFAASSLFALNFVDILHAQYSAAMLFFDEADRGGLRRLSTSLLARADRNATRDWMLCVTQSELAIETGLSRQWVNRLLKRLESRGIAELGRGQVLLRAPGRLSE